MPSGRTHQRIGEILTEDGRLSTLQLRTLLREQQEAAASRRERPRIGELLVRYQLIDEEDLARALAVQYRCPYLEPDPANVRPDLFGDLPGSLLDSYGFVPLGRDEDSMTVAVAGFDEPDLPELLANVTGLQITLAVTSCGRFQGLRSAFLAARRGLETPLEVVSSEPCQPDAGEPPPAPAPQPAPAPAAAPEPAPPAPRPPLVPRRVASECGEPVEVPFPRAMDNIFYRLLQTSVRERYTSVSFSPGEPTAHVLARRPGGRTDQTQVTAEARARVRRQLATAIGVEEPAMRAPVCRKLRWPHEDGVAVFETVLFPPASPELDLNLVASAEQSWTYEEAGLCGNGLALTGSALGDRPELIVLSGRSPRDTFRLWVAMLSDLAAQGRKVQAFEERTSHEIPGVFHHVLDAADRGATRLFSDAGRGAFLASHTDVVAVRADELPPDTPMLLEMSRSQATVVLAMEAASPLGALRKLEQATRVTVRGGLLVTAYRMARLCPFCREAFPIAVSGLPRGFQALVGKVAYRSPGCNVCQFSRQFGSVHFYEVLRLDGERLDRDGIDFYSRPLKEYLLEEGLLVPALREARRALLAGCVGLDDYLALTERE